MIQFIRVLIIYSLILGSLIVYGCHDSGGSGNVENQAPTVTITSPANGTSFIDNKYNKDVAFSGSAMDAEGRELPASVFIWTSNRDGEIKRGRKSFSIDYLSVGTHTITLTVTDSNGKSSFDSIKITMGYDVPPVAEITMPLNNATYMSNEQVPFEGVGLDLEDREVLESTFVWTSSLDGEIQRGSKSFTKDDFSVGTHVITLMVTDRNGKSSSDSITIIIKHNNPPTATIISPVNGSVFNFNSKIFLSGKGYDIEDGELSDDSAFEWTDDCPWCKYYGKTLSTYDFGRGTNSITLTVKDKEGRTGTDTVEIIILPPDYPRITFSKLPDTGQTDSYTNTFGEDSDYPINPRSYTKLDENGSPLADDAVSWVMVRDNVTGLIWEGKTDDGSIHDKDNTYIWDDAQDTYIPSLNTSKFGGYSDWRLPYVLELSTLIDHDSFNPAIDEKYFPNTQPSYYLSADRLGSSYYPECVDFEIGRARKPLYPDWSEEEGGYTVKFKEYVRAVRGGSSPATGQGYVDNHDGTITDTATGLMWKKTTNQNLTWEQAIAYCETLTFDGYSDWRLPNRIELQSLVDYNNYDYIDVGYFPDTQLSYYWSSTSDKKSGGAWAFAFYDFSGMDACDKIDNLCIRAVRGGQ